MAIPSVSTSSAVPLLTAVVGAVLALLFIADYLRRRRADVAVISRSPPTSSTANATTAKPSSSAAGSKRAQVRHHGGAAAADKDIAKKHHHLDINTLKGHTDAVMGLAFSPDGLNLSTACSDCVVRIYRIDDTSSKSFKLLKINLPAGASPTAVAFSEGESSIVVAAQALLGSSLYMYGGVGSKPAPDKNQQGKIPGPEIKWEHHKIHGTEAVLNLSAASATHGTGDGSTIIVSCTEATDIKIWHGKSGKELGTVNTSQLKNNMATISGNGRFIAAAAFTGDVKVWEIIYSKDGSVKEVAKAMQLKGHNRAVTCLCFAPTSDQIFTASKDGTIRVWNINVRYHLDEDPKSLRIFPVPLKDSKGAECHYDHMSISPDGKVLAVTSGSTLQWLSSETGEALDTADKAHDDIITCIAWAPRLISNAGSPKLVLATAGADKKVKLWLAPEM